MIHPPRLNTLPFSLEEQRQGGNVCWAKTNKTQNQQCLPQQADEPCHIQPGLGVKQSPGDAEKQAGRGSKCPVRKTAWNM